MMKMTYTLNSSLVVREESDDWGLLFDPDTGRSFALSPVAVHICNILLLGPKKHEEIMSSVNETFTDIPQTATQDTTEFLDQLTKEGLITCS